METLEMQMDFGLFSKLLKAFCLTCIKLYDFYPDNVNRLDACGRQIRSPTARFQLRFSKKNV